MAKPNPKPKSPKTKKKHKEILKDNLPDTPPPDTEKDDPYWGESIEPYEGEEEAGPDDDQDQ